VSRFISVRDLVALGVVVVAILAATAWVAQTPDSVLDAPVLDDPETAGERRSMDYTLEEGASPSSVGADLEGLGVIRSGRQFQVLPALMGLQDQLSAGEHRLRTNSSVVEVINLITVRDG
jgi:cell division protein YceG involved in septum cleavage